MDEQVSLEQDVESFGYMTKMIQLDFEEDLILASRGTVTLISIAVVQLFTHEQMFPFPTSLTAEAVMSFIDLGDADWYKMKSQSTFDLHFSAD